MAKSPRRRLVEIIQRDPGADVLVVTNMWPEPEQPVYGIFVQRQVAALREAGLACDVLYIRGYRSPWAYPRAALKFAWSSFVWHGRYRVIHVHAGEAALATRFHVGTPIVVTYHGDDILGSPRADGVVPFKSRVRSALVRAHSRLFVKTIAQSREMHQRLPAAARGRNIVLPMGVDSTHFKPLDRDECRRRLGWGEETVALFAGTKPDSPRKRRFLAEAACERASNGRTFRLYVAGTVPPEEMPVLMNAADCLLLTSSMEGSPCVVKEALMCNLPVIATDVGDVAERLEGVRPSWLSEPDADALASALRELAAAPARSNGREAAADLDESRIAQRLLALYDEVAR